jgi:hypothetical protein
MLSYLDNAGSATPFLEGVSGSNEVKSMAIAGGTGDAASTTRYVAEREFPPYAYVPGCAPHPVTDPAGHSYGRSIVCQTAPDPCDWRQCTEYLSGIDLFNHGYYWEAHEVWEAVWVAGGRRGPTADFLKGLIKLAAAGVKCREGSQAGVRRHARRAAELFRTVQAAVQHKTCFGLQFDDLFRFCDIVGATSAVPATDGRPQVVFNFRLMPA